MLRMAPFLVVTTQETNSRDRDPAVDKERIEEPVIPYFPVDANLEQDQHWQYILYDRDDRPQLSRKNRVQNIREVRVRSVYPCRNNKECRHQQEMRLRQMHDTV